MVFDIRGHHHRVASFRTLFCRDVSNVRTLANLTKVVMQFDPDIDFSPHHSADLSSFESLQ